MAVRIFGARKLDQAFVDLKNKIKNPKLREGGDELVRQYQNNLRNARNIDRQPVQLLQLLNQVSRRFIIRLIDSFVVRLPGRQQVTVSNTDKNAGDLNDKTNYAGLNNRLVGIFLRKVYGKQR